MEQRLSGTPLKMWQGWLLVVCTALFLFAAQFVLTFLQYVLTFFRILDGTTAYTVASVGYWLLGGLLGLKFLRDYVLNYLYTASAKLLRVERVYGPGRPRAFEEVYFSRLKAMGAPEEMKARFPDAKTVRATLRRASLPVRALAYETTGGMKILLFQPNEEMWAHIQAALRGRKPDEARSAPTEPEV